MIDNVCIKLMVSPQLSTNETLGFHRMTDGHFRDTISYTSSPCGKTVLINTKSANEILHSSISLCDILHCTCNNLKLLCNDANSLGDRVAYSQLTTPFMALPHSHRDLSGLE